MKIKNFWGDLNDVSAKKEALLSMQGHPKKDLPVRYRKQIQGSQYTISFVINFDMLLTCWLASQYASAHARSSVPY